MGESTRVEMYFYLFIFLVMPPPPLLNGLVPSMTHLIFFPQNSKDSSLLESNKKRKGKLNSKGGKKKKEDLQEVDGEIEAVLQKKGGMEVLWVAAAVFALSETLWFQALWPGEPPMCGDIY